MPKAFSEEERRIIRQRLIAAGRRLINAGGVRKLTIDDAVADAGISKGAFYAFFPSREDFVLSVFESWEDQYRGDFLASMSDETIPPRERWVRFFREAMGMLAREPGLAAMRSADVELLMLRLPPERLAAHQARDQAVLGEAMADWLAKGWVRPEAVAVLPGLFAALFAMALHRDDFGETGFDNTLAFLAEALADRMVPPTADDGGVR